MLQIYTEHADEQARLEEEFPLQNATYRVPVSEADTLQAIIRSISFEYFQNNPPQFVQKIISFANCATHHTLSLTLLREIVGIAHQQHQLLRNYKQHSLALSVLLDLEEDSGVQGDGEESGQESSENVFERAALGQMRQTRFLDNELSQQESEELEQLSIKIGKGKPAAKTQNTTHTAPKPLMPVALNPEKQEPKEGGEKGTRLSNFLCSPENYYGIEGEWWKVQKGSDESKEITRFNVRGNNFISQKSFGKMVVEEQKYDLNRQIQLGRDINKHQELEGFRYNRMMKDKRLSAKLKKRSVKKK